MEYWENFPIHQENYQHVYNMKHPNQFKTMFLEHMINFNPTFRKK